jgi:hypothetical protein
MRTVLDGQELVKLIKLIDVIAKVFLKSILQDFSKNLADLSKALLRNQ